MFEVYLPKQSKSNKMSRCEGFTKNGDRCKRNAVKGSSFCYTHNHHNEENDEVVNSPQSMTQSISQMPTLLYPPAPVRVQVPQPTFSNNSISANTHTQNHTQNTNNSNASLASTSSDIEKRIENLEKLIENLTIVMSSKPKNKKGQITQEKVNIKARWLFYHDHKKDEDIILNIHNGLMNGNMLIYKSKNKNGITTNEPNINYLLIKDATDIKFNQLTEQEKDVYIRRALDAINSK